jgi:hypothetical protein
VSQVQRLGAADVARNAVQELTEGLGRLWGECAAHGQQILRGGILTTLACLVDVLGPASPHLHPGPARSLHACVCAPLT